MHACQGGGDVLGRWVGVDVGEHVYTYVTYVCQD